MVKVAFDSSFLMAVAEHPTDWYGDLTVELGRFEPVMLDCVAEELTRLSKGNLARSRVAGLALKLASGFKVERCGAADVDSELVSFAAAGRGIVATLDSELQATLRARGARVASLRGDRVALV